MLRLFCLATLVAVSLAHSSYQKYIPNGQRVISPCGQGVWHGVGHYKPKGSGSLNPFGKDFAAAGHAWTEALCRLDSDRDGRTNGEELGDPDCQWTSKQRQELPEPTGHPGICEPVGSAKCTWQKFTC
ncbi:temptin [Biomphalaria glabrata]|uniref:Temptin-like n=1 Tax=Biomphalaria glabrata TaxID=6526 RepID=A0A9U8EGC1_BIOGL|nr:temptin-like [Biomphalaria glabrata]KAI8758066.1 temptin-like [Biomphalaria glabrata]KAI8791553.1 temptin [Biomphalaria glabrata]